MKPYYKLTVSPWGQKLLNLCIPMILLTLMQLSVKAQYSNVPLTGFNSDLVANGIGLPTTSTTVLTDFGVDNGNFVFIDNTYQYNSGCAPATTGVYPTTVTSVAASGLTYVLQPSSVNNALRVPATGTGPSSGTLNLTTPVQGSTIYLLSVAGGGQILSGINVTINFTDLTSQTVTNYTAEDWCNLNNNTNYTKIPVPQYNRIQALTATCGSQGTCQYFAELAVQINPSNYGKSIASVTIAKTTATNVFQVFAMGIKSLCTTPVSQPTALSTGSVTTSSIGISFTAAAPAPTGYLVVRYPQGSTPTPPSNGIFYTANQPLGLGTVVDTSTVSTSFTATGLSGSSSYDFYAYSYNFSATCGGPIYLTTSPLTSTIATASCSGTMTGTIMIGPGLPNTVGGGYTSLTQALTEINANGLAGNTLFELQTGYDGTSTNETFPITFPNHPCLSSSRTLTIRPASGVSSALTITANNAGATLNFNGADYVTIDGRPGGTGTNKYLNIINTNAAGSAIQFINDSRNNTITYCDIQGQNTSATSTAMCGVIYFGAAHTTLLSGNDNNTISFCDVHATGTGTPTIGICSYGSTTSAASWNENNTITDNNIYDFFSATLPTTGIKLENGSHAFTISNNRFYQTATRNYTTAAAHRILWLTPNTANAGSPCAFQVINNFIGGNNSAGTGTYTLTGTGVYFWGMDINHWGTTPSSIQGNTITNISVASTITGTTNDFFRGISTGSTGNVNIGTITGNIIGSGTIDRAIILSTTGTGTNAYGIKISSSSNASDTINVYNNTIGGITDSTTTATNAGLFYGIGVTSGSYTNILNNTIGSTTVPNSITLPNPATAVQTVVGINIVTGIANHITKIIGNTIANINNGYISTSTTSLTRGIAVLSSANTIITGNSIYNIKTASTNTGSATTACLMGIIVTTANTTTVTGNTIHSLTLSNPTSTAASFAQGIYISTNGSTPTHSISKNFIHSFDITSPTNTNAAIVGMDIAGGANILSNNMIRLGVKPDGTDLTNAVLIRGIFLNTVTATNVYHNSVYIGGSNIGNVNKNTMAFQRNATGPHDIRNNIFVNNRSNATLGSGGKHYQLFLNTTTTATINNNVYYGVGNDVKFATPNGGTNDSTTYSLNWALSGDVGSTVGDPQFIAPNGNAATANLHIHPTNPSSAESAGTLLASVTDDIDGDVRATNTPNDAGADAGIFVGVNMTIDSTVATQITTSIVTGSLYQQIIGIRMYSRNAASPLQVSSFALNTGLTTNNLDIENARVYYTGSNATFDTASAGLYGTLPVIPNGAFSVTGTRNLIPGVNYFWLAYDVKNTATAGNLVDARVDNISIAGGASPNILYGGDPAGTRTIKAPLNGNYNIGVGQSYITLTSAMSDLGILGVSGPVTLTLKDALYNTTSGETFPITLGAVQGVSATNTITIAPEVSVASRIEANNATAVLDFNGAKYVVIDGRQGGVGTFVSGNNLQIANTGTAGPAVRFINEASFNKLRYVDLKSNNTVATVTAGAGVVNFGTTTGVNGNDTNLIEYCDIHEDAAGFPLIGISSIGSATTVSTNNDGNTIDNCNIYNFFSATTATAGIYVGANNGGWIITNNHVYQTATRTYTSAVSHRGFWITPNTGSLTSASGFIINNNYIGGNAANGTGTYTMAGAIGYFFYGMDLSLGNGTASNVQGNIITNMNIAANSTSIYGININNGNVLCGTITGNIVGSTTLNGAISFTSNTSGGAVLPYRVGSGLSIIFRHNIASGIALTGSTATNAVSFFGMNLSGGTTVLADSNYIGYPTLANSITLGVNTSTTASVALGIITNTGAATSHSIIGNYIGNITNNYSGASTASSVRALHVAPTGAGVFVVSGNKIEQIFNASPSTATAAGAANHAITVNTTAATSITITRNSIRSVNSTSATGAVVTNGIYYAGPTSGNHIISRNLIHSISPTAANPSAVVVGIDANSGNVTVANNMIRLGIDSTGTADVTAFTLRGISKSTGNARIYFNTVYIGGTGVGADLNRTFAFVRSGAGVDTVRNNIFINQRSNGTPIGGGHFAASLNNATTLAMDYNLLRADSIGVFNNLPQLTLTNWKGATGIDANTVASVAGLINPTGSTSSLDLHIQPATPTPIEGSGTLNSGLGLNDDFDGEDRATLTPTDIGADAGNFIPNDVAPPTIAYTALTNTQITTDRTITATISDATGIYLIGTLKPRIYFKKQATGTYVSAVGTLVSGSTTNSVWDFTISSSTLGGVASNDSIYYYIIAQDSTPANNIGSFPGGAEATDVNTVTTHPGNPSKYWITPTLSGIYTVGNTVPCNYSSLTQAINLIAVSVINGPVILELMDPLYDKTTETFPIVLPSLGFTSTNTLTIRPAAGITSVIRDSITHAVLDLNGVDYLTIDGRQGGVGTPNSLTIENRSISNVGYGTATVPNNIPNAIRFINDATNNTLKYVNIRGANGTNESGVIFFSTGTVVGNSYNTIDHCDIGNVTGVANPFTIFCGVGSTDVIGKFNRNIVISNNNIYNFFAPGTGESNGFKISKGNTAWTISGNHFYQTATLTTGTTGTQYIMNLNRRVGPIISDDAIAAISLDSMVIIDNIIGGSGPNASGAPWTITAAGPNFSGIFCELGKNSTGRISRNTFTNFEMNQNTAGNRWIALSMFNGLVNVDSNIIGSVNGINAIKLNSTTTGAGIIGVLVNYNSATTPAGTTRISYNQMGGITLTGNASASVNFAGISITNTGNNTQTYLIEKNIIGNELPNNIITLGSSTSATAQNMVGIINNNPANMIIRDNTIQNMTSTYMGTAASYVHGINSSSGIDTIRGNYISNLISASPQTSAATTNTVAVTGIQLSSASTGNYVFRNTIRNLIDTTTAAVNLGIIGINANGVGNTNIAGNTIYGLGISSSSNGAFVYGASLNSTNTVRFYNNMISLGSDTTGSPLLNTPTIAGINKLNTGSVSVIHNTIKIQGSGVGNGLGMTAAYNRNASGIDTLMNNILINTRSNASTGGAHYAMNLNNIASFTSRNNLLNVGAASSGDTLVGLIGNIGYLSLPAWNTFSSLEVGSKDSAMAFVSATNLHLDPSAYGAYTLIGSVITGIPSDIDGETRSAATPYMGADEIPGSPLPVSLLSLTATAKANDVVVSWSTAFESNNKGFEVQRSVNGKTFSKIGFVKGSNKSTLSNYGFVDANAFKQNNVNVLYYRLLQIDMDGTTSLSKIVLANQSTANNDKVVELYPNPASDASAIRFETTSAETIHIVISDIHGRVIATQTASAVKGSNLIHLENLSKVQAGLYFVNVSINGNTQTLKLIKQ